MLQEKRPVYQNVTKGQQLSGTGGRFRAQQLLQGIAGIDAGFCSMQADEQALTGLYLPDPTRSIRAFAWENGTPPEKVTPFRSGLAV